MAEKTWLRLVEEECLEPRIVWYERYALLHTLVYTFHRHFLEVERTRHPVLFVIVALAFAGFLAGWRSRVLGLSLAAVALLLSNIQQFPFTANHAGWGLIILLTLLMLCADTDEDRRRAANYLFLQGAVVVLWTGIQKVWYGTYFRGEFLILMARKRESFGSIMHFLLSQQEWEKFFAADVRGQDSTVWRSSSPLMLIASNAVWVLEILGPPLLLIRRIRPYVVVGLIAFLLMIQVSALEMVFFSMASAVLGFGLTWKWHRALLVGNMLMLMVLLMGTGLGFWAGDVWN